MSTNGHNRLGVSRLHGDTGRMSATLRRAVEIAVKQRGHTLATRFDASCAIRRPEISPMLDAAHELYWQAVEKAQEVVAEDERAPAQHFDKVMRQLMKDDPVVEGFFGSFVDLIAQGAFMEGFITGSIHAQEQKVTRRRTRNQRPGR